MSGRKEQPLDEPVFQSLPHEIDLVLLRRVLARARRSACRFDSELEDDLTSEVAILLWQSREKLERLPDGERDAYAFSHYGPLREAPGRTRATTGAGRWCRTSGHATSSTWRPPTTATAGWRR